METICFGDKVIYNTKQRLNPMGVGSVGTIGGFGQVAFNLWRVFGVWCFGRRLSAEVTVGRPCGGAQALPLAPGVGADKHTCGAMRLDPEGSTPSHESRPLVVGDTWREMRH